jgi:cytochrome c-type biogenesis protein CcmH/NrfG
MAFILLLIGACSVQPVSTNQYQVDIGDAGAEARPVAELHDQALTALDDNQFQLAIDYLQRAIKIQPRNAWSWHYLAQSYRQNQQFDQCLAMVDRSFSYSSYDDVLELANDRLRAQCQQG